MKKQMKRCLALGLALILCLSLAACSGSSSSSSSETAAATEASAETDNAGEAAEETEAPAEIEDTLVIYTSEPDESMDILSSGFKEMYPNCDIEIIYGSAGDMMSRIIAESADPQCDVMFSGINACDGDDYEPYFEKYVSPVDDELIEDCQSNNGYYNYVIISPCVFYENDPMLEELGVTVTSYEDLLQPELYGLIVTSDPNSSSAAWNNLSNILTVYGYDSDEAWDFIDALMANGLVVISSSSTVFTSVSNGEYAVGLSYESGSAGELYDGVEDCTIVFPSNGSGYIITADAIVKDCKHPNAAKAWIDYAASADAQSNWADALGTMRTTNANAVYETAYLQDYDTVKWVTRDIDWLVDHKEEVLDKWNEIYNKYH